MVAAKKSKAKKYGVVLFGPTGVTGREVARHLARRAPELGITWAVAGRNEERMRQTLEAVGAPDTPVMLADSQDPASIDAMAASATVIANLVGPYAVHGEAVYKACIEHGTHELDLTGETSWVKEMLEEYEVQAAGSGAKLVPVSGYEALPFDVAALVAAERLYTESGEPVATVDIALSTTSMPPVRKPSDAVSGGTYQSGVRELRNGGGSMDALLFESEPHEEATIDLRPRRHAGTKAWLAPMVPSPVLNPPVAQRTAAILRSEGIDCFAADYRYSEGMSMGKGAFAPVAAASLAAGQASATLFGRAPGFIRKPAADVMAKIGPQSGDGPDPDQLDAWSYRLDVRATGVSGTTVDVQAIGQGHPGYKSTATMVAEAALALADPNYAAPDRTGFLTPATALGSGIVDRMFEAGLIIT